MIRKFHILFFIWTQVWALNIVAQQDHSLFLMHYLPESNILNPAVPISCKWYIGIPILSSTHLNYSNSAFSYNTLISKSDGYYVADVDRTIAQMHKRNYTGTEIHTQLFALGYRKNDFSWIFTITEKNNFTATFPKEVVQLAWDGNSQFEGEEVSFKGNGIYFSHYREYALGLSKKSQNGMYLGVKAKVLFGKLNLTTRSFATSLYTHEENYNLNLKGNFNILSSLPITVVYNDIDDFEISYNEDTDYLKLMLNRKNPGFALDFGTIYPYSDRLELSAAVIDLGFIRWRSNINTFSADGDFMYEGPFNDTIIDYNGYFDYLIQILSDSMNLVVENKNYTSMLAPRILAGANYNLSNKIDVGAQGELQIYRTKLIPSLTLSTNYNVFSNTYLMASYSFQNYSFQNLGFGFVIGRSPLQFYMISDNVLGLIWPTAARDENLRFGLNINLGCRVKSDERKSLHPALEGNCGWIDDSSPRKRKKNK